MPTKPVISNPRMEYDSRAITGVADLATVTTWSDTSGQGNDATGLGTPQYLKTGWDPTTPAVRLLSADIDRFSFLGTGFVSTNLTLFAVVRATSLTGGLAIIGNDSAVSPPPRTLSLYINSDGSVAFGFGAAIWNVKTAAGIVTIGNDFIITARFSTTLGKLLRVNRVQRAVDAAQTSPLVENLTARLGFAADPEEAGFVEGADRLYGWISGYSSAASDQQILDMEAFLADAFKVETVWASCAPSPGTVWAGCT